MIKYASAICVLVHLFYITTADMNLNSEILKRLTRLNELHKLKQLNIIMSTSTLRVPIEDKHPDATCGVELTRELRDLLNNVTVPKHKEKILEELQENLEDLDQQQTIYPSCRMTTINNTARVFLKYMTYFRKLNNFKGR